MEIKVFGKSLFSTKSKAEVFLAEVENKRKESKYLPDFYSGWNNGGFSSDDYLAIQEITTVSSTNGSSSIIAGTQKKKVEVKKPEEKKITPKGVYDLKTLNDVTFKLNTDPVYVEKQLEDFKDKLNLLKSEEFDMRRGVDEISSIVTRLENRKRYPEVKTFFEEYPYTTTSKINEMLKKHDHLKLGQIAQFIADMPKEAVDAMKKYNINTDKICKKQAVFYIIADKKDFKKTDSRRDPILLAQSPFGHVWQVLGAWDAEMLFLEEL